MDNAEKELLNAIADGVKDVRSDVKEVHSKIDTLSTSLNATDKKVAILEVVSHSPASCPAISEHREDHDKDEVRQRESRDSWIRNLKFIGWVFGIIVAISGFILTIAKLIGG